MMTFWRRSVHSFMGLSSINITDHNKDQKPPPKCYGGLQGLVNATGDIHRPPNVVESSSVKSSSSSTSPSHKVDARGIGYFVDEDVDGLMSCTESLGFESSYERRVDDHNDETELLCPKTTLLSSSSSRIKWRRRRRFEESKFPPPLSSLYQNGQPSFFLHPVRKDGRLELTEVRIDRSRVFHAFREDGRLRLHIIRDDIHDEDVEDEQEKVVEVEEVVEEERVVGGGEWRFEGFRRCHQNPHGHHNDYHQHHHHHSLLGEVI
ncbi:protein FANTASTIC FOUR 1 [Tripterygium wilfordii]|uniref:Protein FANTASTIC FOUR 1 n=1 Tax=Tripterygium wilfordii TaxID=458696 RepID=A0A7J7CZU1_TRIWF|nr:uncharacterized protein LOC120011355 [Tripterygium wilfordii]KAF5739499.1 protein FANTASTIC FOUR 1 [Tripterygium wilfordii]